MSGTLHFNSKEGEKDYVKRNSWSNVGELDLPNIVHPDEADLLEEAKSIARILYPNG